MMKLDSKRFEFSEETHMIAFIPRNKYGKKASK